MLNIQNGYLKETILKVPPDVPQVNRLSALYLSSISTLQVFTEAMNSLIAKVKANCDTQDLDKMEAMETASEDSHFHNYSTCAEGRSDLDNTGSQEVNLNCEESFDDRDSTISDEVANLMEFMDKNNGVGSDTISMATTESNTSSSRHRNLRQTINRWVLYF